MNNNPSQNNNDNGYLYTFNDNQAYPSNINHNSQLMMNYTHQQTVASSNASAQVYPPLHGPLTGQANADPPLSANNIPFLNTTVDPPLSVNNIPFLNSNPLQPNHNIFSFNIPGFKIIIIPVDSNIITNNPQTQFQQSFNNYNSFSG
ncbi:15357_t:CDS:1 [Funneliformis caledonium]|uniref:15357_t:CDS:1 n=1 Tax=Funneliformis caledonium TaxID=1117310 RepID=A0A9N9DGQ3_9GLOM|nr:15357_t:CDS:1 [Funneliformis caledonium]